MAVAYNAEQPLFLDFFPCGIANLKIRGLQTRAASNREWLRMARVQVVSITKCKVSVLGVDSFFFHHKNQTPGTNMQNGRQVIQLLRHYL